MLRLPAVRLAALRCLRLAIPPPRRAFAPFDRRRAVEGIGALVFRAPEPELSVETDGSPRFPGTPRVPWPCSPTPAEPNTPGHCDVSAWSPRLTRTRTSARSFRGSIARPWHSLSTLRSEGRPSPRKTRFRLPARLCRAGFVHPQGSDERFPSFESLPPLLSFPAQCQFIFSWRCRPDLAIHFKMMGRLPRPNSEGLVFHALNRGNNRADVFHDPDDHRAFLDALAQTRDRYPFDFYGYCLMTNHFQPPAPPPRRPVDQPHLAVADRHPYLEVP